MPYCTIDDLEDEVPRATLDRLSRPKEAGYYAPRIIVRVDALIDQFNTASWTADQKKDVSAALSIERFFKRHGSGKIPKVHKDAADAARELLDSVGQKASGQKASGIWHGVVYDPALQETQSQLDNLALGTDIV